MEGSLPVQHEGTRPWQGDLCQFFTRESVARYCLRQLALPANILSLRLLEPAAGHGAFFIPLISKLASACRAQRRSYAALSKCIRAYEIDPVVAASLQKKCTDALCENGVSSAIAKKLARYWVRNEDFLEARIRHSFSHIVSNPPYIRWDAIPAQLRESYKARFVSFKQRADLYVAFIERALELLQSDGQLGFLCPGNWTRNGYGGSVRELLTSKGYLKKIVDFSDVDSFEQSADAYPYFFVFQKDRKGPTQIFSMSDGEKLSRAGTAIRRHFNSSATPLLLSRNSEIEDVLKRAQNSLFKLEEAGCTVRVGSATGCNSVFLGSAEKLNVEKDRLLPFINARSIRNGIAVWRGTKIVNVFDGHGDLVRLSEFPRLRAYLKKHKKKLQARAKASKSKYWWRSIDVLHPDWHRSSKLLVVDISAKPVIGLDTKGYCAGSGVYQIKSSGWPLEELLTLLSAGVLGLFISGLSTGTEKGFHRFQKRHICSVRIPKWEDVNQQWLARFQGARKKGSLSGILNTVAELYDCEPKLLRAHVARDWQSFAKWPRRG
jgi:adenine-specific DNA-methyltransferase